MAVILDENVRVVVQGITGREGRLRTKLMCEYGTKIVAGVTPGKGGMTVYGVPVFDTVKKAWRATRPIDLSVSFVPPHFLKGAALEAMDAGIKTIVLMADRVPQHDVLEILAYSKRKGVRVIGPDSIGMISPGRALVGMIGGDVENARRWFKQGPVGILSRSGGFTTTTAYWITQEEIGQSTAISIGGDPVVGSDFSDLLPLFEDDEQTQLVVIFGEIGSTMEERAADVVKQGKYTKPLVVFIAGTAATPGVRFSHAGAIVERGRGSAQSKVAAFREAGVPVTTKFSEVPKLVKKMLRK